MQIGNKPEDAEIKRSKILIVDDDPTNALIVKRLLDWAGFANVEVSYDPLKAVDLLKSFNPDLVILDYHMPGLDGIELTRHIRVATEPAFLPILMFTADLSKETKEKALTAGANDFLTKPGEGQEIVLRVRNFLHMRQLCKGLGDKNRSLEEIVEARTHELEQSNQEIVERLAKAAEYRDENSGRHTVRVGELSASIAKALNVSEFEVALIRRSAPLHDIGNIGVPDSVLAKHGELTPAEQAMVKRHVEIGLEILKGGHTPLLKMAERIVATHHERFDGTGYPRGLVGSDIALAGRIVAVADAFDALTNNRPYRAALSRDAALQELWRCSGTQFDPKVVEALVSIATAKPPASVGDVQFERTAVAA